MSDELKERLDAAMEAYWRAAYQQGVEGRNHDDMNGTAQFAEDNLRALFAHLSAPIKPPLCPRPCNHRPDVFSQQDCVEAGECGCGANHPPPQPLQVAEILTVDMSAPLSAIDRLRAIAGGSRDIAFEPSDADEILEKLEALAAILSAPNLEIGDAPAPAEHMVAVIESAERLASAAADMATAANMGMCDEVIEQVREAIAAYRANGGGA